MTILMLLVLILYLVSVVLAVIKREESPLYYAVMSAVTLYVLGLFLK